MNHHKRILRILAIGLLTLGVAGVTFGDDNDRGERGKYGGWLESRPDVAPVANEAYSEECGSCHLAYQPGLLPAQAWEQVMEPVALVNHYGDDASLMDNLRREMSAYLTANSADQAARPRSRAFAVPSVTEGSALGAGLPRITETRYFLRKHNGIPMRLVNDNPEVGGFSQCNTCHRRAVEGVYNDHEVSIPGHGSWED